MSPFHIHYWIAETKPENIIAVGISKEKASQRCREVLFAKLLIYIFLNLSHIFNLIAKLGLTIPVIAEKTKNNINSEKN